MLHRIEETPKIIVVLQLRLLFKRRITHYSVNDLQNERNRTILYLMNKMVFVEIEAQLTNMTSIVENPKKLHKNISNDASIWGTQDFACTNAAQL